MAKGKLEKKIADKSMEISDEGDFLYGYTADGMEKKLIYKPDLCSGCNICVQICPFDAIELGPVTEIATGEIDSPYILIDQDKCEYCGLCTLCPLNAIEFTFNDEDIKKLDDYPRLKRSYLLDDEKCVKCFLCEEVCPMEAIEADVKVKKKEDIVKYPEGVSFKDLDLKGTLNIDLDKCTYCKLCDKLCDALEIVPTDSSPLNIYGGKRIDVYWDECDYCGLCEDICPVDAIKVTCESEVDREIGELSIEGEIKRDPEKCIYCNWCGTVCFEDAIEVKKAITGEITLTNLENCDPLGCKACIEICPTESWYIPREKDQKIDVDKRFCIYCGSCEVSCPEKCIILDRDNVKYTEFDLRKPWAISWLQAIDIIKGIEKKKISRIIPIKQKEIIKEVSDKIPKIPKVDEETWNRFQEKLDNLMVAFGKSSIRFYVEGQKNKKPKIKDHNEE
jgi:4Fe-4S ferredoxin